MKIPIYQIDAFSATQFHGNPAAVCPLDAWLEDDLMQKIAAENNLSETAFFVKQADGYQLRWFTPNNEVDLCGHATLASAYVIYTYLEPSASTLRFHTLSGVLEVAREEGLLAMIFPSRPGVRCDAPDSLIKGLGKQPLAVYKSRDYMAVFADEQDVVELQPNMDELSKLDSLGVIATAKSTSVDFVSRFFAPRAGVPEDPVTGSAHSTLIPYWSGQLGKADLIARQVSARGGRLYCTDLGATVKMRGAAAPYLEGFINV